MVVQQEDVAAAATATATQHPYYPRTASIPGFVANQWPMAQLMAVFVCAAGAIVVAAYRVAAVRCSRRYYILNRTSIAGQQTVLAQLWKEYALSDSRYLTSDVFTVCVETITLVWGPLCWLTVGAVLGRSPARHGLQLVVCTAHLHSVALYYATNWAEHRATGRCYSRPEFLYYWVYYVGFNMPWVVVPSVLFCDSFAHMSRAFAALDGTKPRSKVQ
ncbi:emopamil binding protein [Hirsutella rhossiliensis]|uniref:Emopamil binding protein n=1 Tax=Hirsutella rhossiliensis TaxID=111463 RepID=A0A9P8SHW1_9HYPO|nr:emopamil binding protein [Hirsutella rhossiliensis]KAH0963558.1 emopamil binding protein [Hirsutella rhossiliensis]